MKREDSSIRIRIISVFVIAFALVLIGRLYLVQIVRGDIYSNKADRQYVQSTHDFFDRGSIFFQTKDGDNFPAAALNNGFILAINPKLITNPEEIFTAINNLLPINKTEFLLKAGKHADPYEEIAGRVPAGIANKIEELNLKGVDLYRERWRFYPANSLAAHTLGFVAYKDNILAGRYGLERYYEDTLKRNNDSAYINFFVEIFSNLKLSLSSDSSLEGDVVTWIEPSVQSYLEQALKKANEEFSSQYTGGIIMDPMTGAIYAMGITPTFDPNNLRAEKNSDIFSNPLVERVYEMGSIVKALTLAAAIDTGAITPESVYNDTGTATLNKKTFSNHDGKARGLVGVQAILDESLNIGAAHVAIKMGTEAFATYIRNFGIGEETGIDLPNETRGLISNLNSPRQIEYATASFGQGIAMTPIETVRALATLGNGGKLVNPRIAKEIQYKIGGTKKISLGEERQVLKPETSEKISKMLVHVVDNALLGGTVKMDKNSIAAKTGTAQIARAGGYYPDKYLHSFFGYFPAYKPRFIVFLYTLEPKGVRFASETLTVPFMDITKFLINYYEIPPDR